MLFPTDAAVIIPDFTYVALILLLYDKLEQFPEAVALKVSKHVDKRDW